MNSNAEEALLHITKTIEEQIDQNLAQLEVLSTEDLERMRNERLAKLKKRAEQVAIWKSLGHGEYSELSVEQDFFDAGKKSEKVICHFFIDSSFRCKIFDKHLNILANKHIEARFCKINAEKSPFLTKRLSISVLPCIIFIKNGEIFSRMIGFSELGNIDEFPTEVLAWRLGVRDMIEYSGNKSVNPMLEKEPEKKKGIRDGLDRGSDSEEEGEPGEVTPPRPVAVLDRVPDAVPVDEIDAENMALEKELGLL